MKFLATFILLFIICQSNAQLTTTSNKKQYEAEVAKNSNNALINLKELIPTVVLDLRYATKNNFTKTNLYKRANTTYLRKEAANALQKAATQLAEKNYYIKIFDAYRPYAATKLMWELIKDERYVANPKNGSNHNRGLAIDLTLVDANGKELDMGTGFDNFTDSAHHSFTALSAEVLQNRKLLKTTMESVGFKALDSEWWHYSYNTKDSYSVLDLKFALLRRLIK